MLNWILVLSLAGVLATLPNSGRAQERQVAPAPPGSGAPGVITSGSGNVSVGGQAAAGKTDVTDSATTIVEGSSNVFINGKPAATVGDRNGCGGIIVGGASNVYVNGKLVARAGDLTTGCATK